MSSPSEGEADAASRKTRLAAIAFVAVCALGFGAATGRGDVALAAGGVALVAAGLVAGAVELVRFLVRGQPQQPKKRPPFAKGYPKTPELNRLLEAFRAGNWAYVRREAPVLAAKTDDEQVRRAAVDLRRRLEPDPTAVYLVGVGFALLVLLYGYYVTHAP